MYSEEGEECKRQEVATLYSSGAAASNRRVVDVESKGDECGQKCEDAPEKYLYTDWKGEFRSLVACECKDS